jgi:hypothetical protein
MIPMAWNSTVHRFLVLMVLGLGIGACADSRSGPTAPSGSEAAMIGSTLSLVETVVQTTDSAVSAIIGPEGGVLEIPGGHSLHFPAGALAQPVLIEAVSSGSAVRVDFGPHGLVFPDSALPTLTLSYANTAGIDPAELVIAYLDADGVVQELLTTEIDALAQVARARIRHFSTYALMTD